MADANTPGTGLTARLARTRFMTGAMIVVERGWPLVLPVLVVAALFLTVSWFGLFRLMPDWLRIATAVAFAVGGLAALYPLRYLRRPATAEIDRRIERYNRLEHAPVTAQSDRVASGADPFAAALWREHQQRMAKRLGELDSDLPRTGVPERDPWGLRAAVALTMMVALAYSFGPHGGSMTDAFRQHMGFDAVPARIDAWVTPPRYTGRAPIFLTADGNRDADIFSVPEGSEIAVRVTGGSGQETLQFTAPDREPVTIDPAEPTTAGTASARARQFTSTLHADGAASLKDGEAELGNWLFSVIPDNPPEIRFSGEPARAVNGAMELTYEIEDDYGAASAKALIDRADKAGRKARALYDAPEMPLTLPRARSDNKRAKTSRDLTEHPWAGAEVDLQLNVTDHSGQQGLGEKKTIRLPERTFANPLARSVIEQRRILAMDAHDKPRVLDLLEAITLRPEDTIDNAAHYLGLMSIRSRLKMAEEDDELRDVVDLMWGVALGIENGSLSDAERRLRQAQEALRDALERGASDEEIEQLMAELREAMDQFLREFAERAMKNPQMSQQMPQNSQELRQNDLQRMLDQIEELAKSGARDKAQELLSQLEQMMNNLQMAQPQQGQDGQQSEMRERMDELGEIMRRQQEMMNETFQLDQMQRGQRQRGKNRGEQQQGRDGQNGQQGEQGEQGQGGMSPEEFAEALRRLQEGQGQLGGDLQELMDALNGMGIQPGEGFGEAGEAMGEAEGALGQGQGDRAVGEQGRALEALRRGAQDMMQQMQQAMQGENGGGEEGGRQRGADRDPLGRPRATTGPDFGDTVEVPDEIDVQRAREILEAIRRRLGNALSPQLEKDYLERLLEIK